ncbi:DNA-binding response regulator [Rhodoblastus sphagnicola]|uniref:DNA-binding response regulator n=1 Tax=Rhodoblastus sphagnicola TaxID=333368 RepID=A0A2S6NEG3_9HYPH|nr:response regulator transcription factor [Rhodoblastus sphagnicola]MBB4200166.1 DNA-binding NarL/FixJ family response regulator [Rhodoblastus sphagnicola]PPQ32990.1 DNA-binding response regulator [Rhodoblastus sphagnicola]
MRILIVDDHPMVREGCRGILSREADLEVFDAHNAAEALKACAETRFDIIVVDINLPEVSGYKLLQDLLKKNSKAKILAFSMNEDPGFVSRAIDLGACGFVAKTEDPADFLKAIRTVANGEKYLSNSMAMKLAFAAPKGSASQSETLTPREAEILDALANGKAMVQIAHDLNVSYKTVANNCTLLKLKLNARSNADLIRLAVERRAGGRSR